MIKVVVNFTILAFLFCFSFANAQEFHGQAVYESKTQMKDRVKISGSGMTPEMEKQLEEKMIRAFEKTYILDFNKTESVFTEEVKLDVGKPTSGIAVKMSNAGKKYKNTKEKIEISEEDGLGKEFLVTDSLKKWDWKLENETKKIGNYVCHKAVATIPVTAEEIAEYEAQKKEKSEGKTTFFSMSEPKEEIITVWYTPEIPVSHGPENYWGLPGLILEASNGSTVFLCSKIVLNPKQKSAVKRPTKGKKVTKSEYDLIMKKQFESMKDSNGNIEIHIQN